MMLSLCPLCARGLACGNSECPMCPRDFGGARFVAGSALIAAYLR
jgi:uncharacterized protein (UPF0212 family)